MMPSQHKGSLLTTDRELWALVLIIQWRIHDLPLHLETLTVTTSLANQLMDFTGIMNNEPATIAVIGQPSSQLDKQCSLAWKPAKMTQLYTNRLFLLQGRKQPQDLTHPIPVLLPFPQHRRCKVICEAAMDVVLPLLDQGLHQLIVLAFYITIAMQSSDMARRVS
jgi:hypothetical protein